VKRYSWFAAGCFLLLWLQLAGIAAASEWVSVKWVDDGDTILLTDGRRVRYIGINSPEVAHPEKGLDAELFGEAAKARNKSLVYGHRVRLEFDREKTDRYGRVLAYVYLEDGTFINLRMVESGYAYVLVLKPNNRFERVLLKAQRRAMKTGLGIWSDWKEEEKESIVGNKRSRRFHRTSCPNAATIHPKNRVALSSRWEAYWLGFAPAKQCAP
jgi:endonuclease YncB( thermonuclease family)